MRFIESRSGIRHWRQVAGPLLALGAALLAVSGALAVGNATRLISHEWENSSELSDHSAFISSASHLGRYVAFDSRATNLVESDGNDTSDIFVYDVSTQTMERLSEREGEGGNGHSRFPVISRDPEEPYSNDGRFVVFQSEASNLGEDLPGLPAADTNGYSDIFLYDRLTGELTRVSVSAEKELIEGEYYFKEANGPSGSPSVTDSEVNPLYPGAAVFYHQGFPQVIFESQASNLVSGDTNGKKDLFLRFVYHEDCYAPECTPTRLLTRGQDNQPSNGDSSHPVVTPDGRFLAFVSTATNLVTGINSGGRPQVYLTDLQEGQTWLVSRRNASTAGNGESRFPAVALSEEDGRVYVAFHSTSSNLVDGDTNGAADVFVAEIDSNVGAVSVRRASLNSEGVEGNKDSLAPALGANGRVAAFTSYASNLVTGDDNNFCVRRGMTVNCPDIFVHDLQVGQTWRVSLTSDGLEANEGSGFAALNGSGQYAYFTSYANLLTDGGDSGRQQIFQRDQGNPPGNPNVQPSSWNAAAWPGSPSERTFRLTFLNDLALTDPPLLYEADPGFEIVGGIDECTARLYTAGEVCYVRLRFSWPGEINGEIKRGTLVIPVEDDRGALYIALRGQAKTRYFFPFVQ